MNRSRSLAKAAGDANRDSDISMIFSMLLPTEEAASLVEQFAGRTARTRTQISSRVDSPSQVQPLAPAQWEEPLPWLLEVERPMADAEAIDEDIEAYRFLVEDVFGGQCDPCRLGRLEASLCD